MTDKPEAYISCANCGKIILESHSLEGVYCSEECTGKYLQCPNCGGFFPSAEREFFPYCSKDCSQQFKLEMIEENIDKYKELL
ncbi:MAG: hypothetical protein JXR70_13645 [Spirochaetales bacterium]|nr:hypothetical protein [Spirochaetales bacterium]